jgi:hypothetical protein
MRRLAFKLKRLLLLILSVALAMARAEDSVALTVSSAFILDFRILAAVTCHCLLL